MVVFERNKSITILYAARGFRTGKTVSCIIYKSDGTEAKASHSMTEVGSTGVYTTSFVPLNIATYFSVCDCTEYPKKAYKEYHVVKQWAIKGGVINAKPMVKVWTFKDKDLLINMIKGISKSQLNLANEVPAKFDIISNDSKRTSSELIEKSDTSLRLSEDIKQESAKLVNEGIKTIAEFKDNWLEKETETIENKFAELHKKLSAEIIKLPKLAILDPLNSLNEKIVNLSLLTDEVNANLKLSTDLFSGDIRKKINTLAVQTDELILLMKNAN